MCTFFNLFLGIVFFNTFYA